MSTTGRLYRDINYKVAHLKDRPIYELEANHYFLTPTRGGSLSFVKDEIPIKESVKRELLRIPYKDIPFFKSYIRWKSLSRVAPKFSYFEEGRLAFLFDKNGMAVPCAVPWLIREFSPFRHHYYGFWANEDEASLIGLSLVRIKNGGKPEAYTSSKQRQGID